MPHGQTLLFDQVLIGHGESVKSGEGKGMQRGGDRSGGSGDVHLAEERIF